MKKYNGIILCGGKGTRIKNYTKKIPKCLIKFNGKPFLYYQLKYLKNHNINNVILSVGYLSNKIIKYVKKNIDFINIKIVNEKKPLGTGGAVIKSLKYLNNNFFILYGDSYLNFDIKKMLKKKSISTMAVYKNNNKFDKSNVRMNKKAIIYEKKKPDKKANYIDYGVTFVKKSIFKSVSSNSKFDISILYEELSKKKLLKGYIVKKRFYEIGSYNGIKEFKKYILKNETY